MNKHWYTYSLVLCAMLFSNCAENSMHVEDIPEKTASCEVPISFICSFVDNAVTRHANELCKHAPTMGVWGWCTGSHETDTPVFIDQLVVHNKDSARWEYAPLQYWREGCSYTFSAYAPHQQDTGCEISIDSDTHMISIKNVTLHGHNLQSTPSNTMQAHFRDTPDTDWMIARGGQTVETGTSMGIEFMMQHILGKLNICIKGAETILSRPCLTSITVDSMVVSKLPSQGDFIQQLTHTPLLNNPDEMSIEEWAVHESDLQIKCERPCTLATTPTYLVESLVMPHHIDDASTVKFYYTYHFADGTNEQCRYRIPLTKAFSRIVSGYNHTLTFIICSNRIVFEAGTIDWKEENDVEQ